MPKVKVGDINIYYEIHGQGEPLVMICGISTSLDWYYNYIPVCSPEYRLVLFDNRGAGQSDAPDIPYTMEMMADDLTGLLDIIGIDSANIWGHSMGGMIAQEFTLRYPERVRTLVLVSTYCGGPGSSMIPDPEVRQTFQRLLNSPDKEKVKEDFLVAVSQKFMDDNPALIDEILKQTMKHPSSPLGVMRQGGAATDFNTYERLPEIKAPTLVIHGDSDKLFPVENAQILASRIPGAELVIFPETEHMLLEAGEDNYRVTLEFLKRHSQER